jgi:hypothetical protein
MRRLGPLVAVLCAACGHGTTGSGLVEFTAYGAGPAGVSAGYERVNALGYRVQLDEARLYVGGLYANQNVPLAGAQEQPCVLPGLYVAEVTSGLLLDLLDDRRQEFPAAGVGLEERGRTGEVWLKSDGLAVDAAEDPQVVALASGTARRDEDAWPFRVSVTIGSNRRLPDPDPQKPGANPICAERIVSRIPVDITPRDGGTLVLRVDPQAWFEQVDFADLAEDLRASDGTYVIPDAPEGRAAIAVFNGIKSVVGYEIQTR